LRRLPSSAAGFRPALAFGVVGSGDSGLPLPGPGSTVDWRLGLRSAGVPDGPFAASVVSTGASAFFRGALGFVGAEGSFGARGIWKSVGIGWVLLGTPSGAPTQFRTGMGPGEIGRSRGRDRHLRSAKIVLNPGPRKSFAVTKNRRDTRGLRPPKGHQSPMVRDPPGRARGVQGVFLSAIWRPWCGPSGGCRSGRWGRRVLWVHRRFPTVGPR
jgi:hypothetical protein